MLAQKRSREQEDNRHTAVTECIEFIDLLADLAKDSSISPRTRIESCSVARSWARERNDLLGLHKPKTYPPEADDLYADLDARAKDLGISSRDDWNAVMQQALSAEEYEKASEVKDSLEAQRGMSGTYLVHG